MTLYRKRRAPSSEQVSFDLLNGLTRRKHLDLCAVLAGRTLPPHSRRAK